MTDIVESICEVVGGGMESIGALYLANRYLNKTRLRQIPWPLLSSLWNGQAAVTLAHTSETLARERAITSLKGVTYLIAGFIVKAFPHVLYLATRFIAWTTTRGHTHA